MRVTLKAATGTANHIRPRAWRRVLGALLLLTLVGAAAWRSSSRARDPRWELVEAVGRKRYFEARLAGGFRYGPLIDIQRAAPPGRSSAPTQGPVRDWALLAAGAHLKDRFGTSLNLTDRTALAAAHLLLGGADESIAILETLTKEAQAAGHSDSTALSDLAASYLVRAERPDHAEDLPAALEHASQAAEADPGNREALFNRALALERLHLAGEARRAWKEVAALESDEEWRGEAERRASAPISPPGDARILRDRVVSALDSGEALEVDAAVRGSVEVARRVLISELLLDSNAIPLQRALDLARSIARVTGDESDTDLVKERMGREGERVRALCEAWTLYEARKRAAAAPLVDSLVADRFAPGIVRLWSRYMRNALLQNKDLARAVADQERLVAELRRGRYRVVLGRSLWALGIMLVSKGDSARALETLTEARAVLESTGQQEFVPYMDLMRAEAFTELGNDVLASEALLTSLEGRSRLTDPARRLAVLVSASQESARRQQPRVALAFLDEGRPDARADIAESLPLQWVIDTARARERVSPESGLSDLKGADGLLAKIVDSGTRERMAHELSVARAELSVSRAAGGTLAAVRAGLETTQARQAGFRLPLLRLNEGRLLAEEGRFSEAAVAFEAGLKALEAGPDLPPDLAYSLASRSHSLHGYLVECLWKLGASAEGTLAVASRAYRVPSPTQRWKPADGALAADEAVVAYLETPAHVAAWVLRSSGVSQFTLAPMPAAAESLGQVSARLIAPLRPRLSGVRRLVVVPGEGLRNLPFGELPYADRKAVADSFDLSLAPSMEFAMARPPATRGGASRIVILSDPATGGRAPRLPGAAREAAEIRALNWAGVESPPDGREWQRAAHGAGFLYIGAHAKLDPRRPSRSRFLTGPDERGDLTLDAIRGTDLTSVSLVVLAACRSADDAGKNASGFSLALPFLDSGAHAAIGYVHDLEDSDGAAFVEILRQVGAGMPPSRALRQLRRAPKWARAAAQMRLFAPLSM
ncbi:MAG: CHAT domain-containing protein [Vicinamibacteria bacterium]|nr:CHAT domain-containing protein [Vicinamibacteria bacterium]